MGRQDYDGGFSSDGTGAAASDSNFGGSYSTSSAFDYSGDSDGGMTGSEYYQSAINRVNGASQCKKPRRRKSASAKNKLTKPGLKLKAA